MQEIQWLFLGWFIKFIVACAVFMMGLHQAAKFWRNRRQRSSDGPVAARPAGLTVARR